MVDVMAPLIVIKAYWNMTKNEGVSYDEDTEFGRDFITQVQYHYGRLRRAGKKTTAGAILKAFQKFDYDNTGEEDRREFRRRYKGWTVVGWGLLDGVKIMRLEKRVSDPEKAGAAEEKARGRGGKKKGTSKN